MEYPLAFYLSQASFLSCRFAQSVRIAVMEAKSWWERLGLNAPFALTVIVLIGGGVLMMRDVAQTVSTLERDFSLEQGSRTRADTEFSRRLEQLSSALTQAINNGREERRLEAANIAAQMSALALAMAEMRGRTDSDRQSQDRVNSAISSWMVRQEERWNRGQPRPQSDDWTLDGPMDMHALLPHLFFPTGMKEPTP